MNLSTRLASLFALILSVLPSFGEDVTAIDPTKHYIGMNPNFQVTWAADSAFVDLANTSRVTMLTDWNTEPPRDQSGYPTTDFRWIFAEGYSQIGVHKLSFTGQATFPSTGGYTVGSVVYDSATNRTTADITVTQANTTLYIDFSNTKRTAASATNTGLTGIKLIRPGYPTDGSVVYTTDFLNQFRRTHVFRSMNWTQANTNYQVTWDQRIRPDIFCQTLPGHYGLVALEHLLRVANETNNDLWVCIPVRADADTVTKTIQMALYGSDGTNPYTSPQASPVYPPLAPNLKLYIEFANEIWNGFGPGFENYGMVKADADAIRLSSSPHPIKLNDSGDSDEYVMAGRYWAWRAAEISKSCRAASPADFMTRVRPVLMCQQGGGWLDKMIPFLNAYYGTGQDGTGSHPINYYFYGLGGTSYVYGDDATFVANGNASAFIQSIDLPTLAAALKAEALYARNEGIKHILYEGGPHPQSTNVINDAGWEAINADPTIENKLIEVSDVLDQAGVDLAVYFQSTGGAWGYTIDISDFNSPKYRAIDTLRTTRPRQPITLGTPIPGTVNLRTADAMTEGTFNTTYDSRDSFALTQGYINCLVRSTQSGTYTLNFAANATTPNSSYSIWINGSLISTITLTQGTWTQPTVTTSIPAGLSSIRIQTNSAADWTAFAGITLTRIDVAPTITSTAPADGVEGTAYTHNYTASGTTPITYSVTAGALPSGLTLSSAGILSGTPTALGTFTGTVTANNGTAPNATQTFSLTITASPVAPAITSIAPAGGVVGTTYTHSYAASGTGPITYSVTAGALPSGLTLSSAGVLSGTPTATGTFTGTVTATNGTAPNSSQAFSIIIRSAPVITSAAPGGGIIGTAYSTHNYTATGTGTITYSVTAGALPLGLTLNSAGVLSGTPINAGTYNGTVTATNGTAPDATQDFSIVITSPPSPPTITSAAPGNGMIGVPYSTHTYAANGSTPITYTVTAGALPTGLTLSSAGVLSGTPWASGTFSGTVTAANSMAPAATQAFNIVIGGNSIAIPDPSFETNTGYNNYPNWNEVRVAGTGWTGYSDANNLTNNSGYTNQLGSNALQLVIENGTVVGTNPSTDTLTSKVSLGTYAANTTYTFTVAAVIPNIDSTVSARISLLGDANAIAATFSKVGNTFTANDAFQDISTSFTTGASGGFVGQNIYVQIGIESSNQYGRAVVYDNLRLTSSPVPVVSTASFTPAAGTYTSTQTITISSTTAGASIRYTTDGSTPTSTSGTVYTAPVSVNASQTLKAIAYKSGMTDSSVSSAVYVINLPSALANFRTLYGLAADGSQDLLTPAGDGVQNLLKYAFNMLGSGPGQVTSLTLSNASILTAGGTAGLPLVGVESGTGKLQLTYIRRKSATTTGITYAVEFSDVLATWAVNASATESTTSLDPTFERVTVTDSVTTPVRRFVRVRVTAP